jgi:bifunctional non-homologous end joining protein LigD
MGNSNWPVVESQAADSTDTLDLGECKVKVFNVDRMVWPGIPKAHLLEYYHAISPYLLPYLKDRPQSLHLKLKNANAPGLYIKDMEGREPDCAAVFTDVRRHKEKGKRDQIDYLICNNEPTLLWMINLGCIDINPWNSRVSTPDNPDYLVVDLDPSLKDGDQGYLGSLLNTAIAAKAYFDKHKIKAFAKTSGKTGIHFYVPCAGIAFPDARKIAEQICGAIVDLVPASATAANSISQREGKVYVDPSQNDYADTLAAPYSLRPYASPKVSAPLEWSEINERLDPAAFTIDTILSRIKKKGDLFKGVLDKTLATRNMKTLSKT